MEGYLLGGWVEAILILVLPSAFAARNCYQSGVHSHFGIGPEMPRMEKRSTRTALAHAACKFASACLCLRRLAKSLIGYTRRQHGRSEEHTSELQSLRHLVC